jgi:hypothetical protein
MVGFVGLKPPRLVMESNDGAHRVALEAVSEMKTQAEAR